MGCSNRTNPAAGRTLRFSLLTFGPLLILLLATLPCVGISCLPMLVIALFEPGLAFSRAEVVGCFAWGLGPLLAIPLFLGLGAAWFWGYERCGQRRGWWAALWLLVTALFFGVSWYGVALIASLGASDYAPRDYYTWCAQVAAGLTAAAQVGLIPWLAVISRLQFKKGASA